jgi:hypothetical protein
LRFRFGCAALSCLLHTVVCDVFYDHACMQTTCQAEVYTGSAWWVTVRAGGWSESPTMRVTRRSSCP